MISFRIKTLESATVQEIQLELIRRSSFNAFDGEKVVATLLAHRELWQAVIMDRIGFSRSGGLAVSELIKLRDLDANLWNADTLYILTHDREHADQLVQIAARDRWSGEVYTHDDPNEVEMALGSTKEGQVVVRVWWD
jgi:hypothetical protein